MENTGLTGSRRVNDAAVMYAHCVMFRIVYYIIYAIYVYNIYIDFIRSTMLFGTAGPDNFLLKIVLQDDDVGKIKGPTVKSLLAYIYIYTERGKKCYTSR